MPKQKNWKLMVDTTHGNKVKGRYTTENRARLAEWFYLLIHPRRITRIVYATSRRTGV